jgi:hypothetical protein
MPIDAADGTLIHISDLRRFMRRFNLVVRVSHAALFLIYNIIILDAIFQT